MGDVRALRRDENYGKILHKNQAPFANFQVWCFLGVLYMAALGELQSAAASSSVMAFPEGSRQPLGTINQVFGGLCVPCMHAVPNGSSSGVHAPVIHVVPISCSFFWRLA